MAEILPGKPFADKILESCASELEKLELAGIRAGLAIVLVGEDPASITYVGRKRAACKRLGINSFLERMPADSSTEEIIAVVQSLNANPVVHGILVQQPFPNRQDALSVVKAIDPCKDADGLHPLNVGLLAIGATDQPVACTPQGCLHLLREVGIDPKGKRATVVGRSMIVGRPLSLLLDRAGATVSVCHSDSRCLAQACRDADILAVATGCPNLVSGSMVKPGAIVLDIGISRNEAGDLCGDVDVPSVSEVAAYLTPVPGGIGPLTVAMLMYNTVKIASKEIRCPTKA